MEQDTPDLRDQLYRPTLRPLGPVQLPRKELLRLRVRDQGAESSCAGQALASMIDFLRVAASPPGKVSQSGARMLIEFARRVEQRGNGPPAQGVNSLRSAIKASYHNGVCLDEHWPYVPREPHGDLTPERSKEMRKLALGAHFRLEPVLNDYHAALNEAGAVCMAAHVHDGWDHAAVEAVGERIAPGQRSTGAHAFVVVGYDGAGFLVLNSWGEGWGRYKDLPGVAHWPYADWAGSVLDGWVLRLAVSAPDAFHIGVGLQGPSAGMNVPVASASTPRIELVGQYLHLDDGLHVTGGRYPSSPAMLAETVGLLRRRADGKAAGGRGPGAGGKKRDYEHVLLWLAGANETTKDSVADAARLKRTQMRARGDVLLAGANGWARLLRRWAFESRLAGGYEGPVIVWEGDSWFQYPLRLEDVIDHLMNDYAILSLDAASDTLQNMFDEGEYLGAIQKTKAPVFLFSGGGNDVLGGGNLSAHLREFDPSLSPADHILPSYREVLDHAIALYDRIFRSVEDAPGDVLTLCHGYDRPIPNGGKWLGRPMRERGIEDRAFQNAITATMVERFNARLKKLADAFPRVEYIDQRGVVGDDPGRWDDELHPTSAGYADVAARFRAVIEAKAAPRSLAEVAAARRATRTRAARRRALQAGAKAGDGAAAPTPAAPRKKPALGRQGLSLHVGLNTIDPGHYGTDGALVACESDAEDMASLARAAGFRELALLKSADATRKAVIGAIEDAAKRLKPGDIFLFTYAGHGSQMPDFNHDEEARDGLDETFCLYDAMLVDDELYQLWGMFQEDVRVLVVSDSCHSGSNIRVPRGAPEVAAGPHQPAARWLDPIAANRTLRRNQAFYSELQRRTRAMDEGLLVRELSQPLRCSVLLLSGCQDDEVSLDGVANGRFTQELLGVWGGGRLQGRLRPFPPDHPGRHAGDAAAELLHGGPAESCVPGPTAIQHLRSPSDVCADQRGGYRPLLRLRLASAASLPTPRAGRARREGQTSAPADPASGRGAAEETRWPS